MQKFVRNHPRLLVAVAAGVLTDLALPHAWPSLSRALLAWNAAVFVYLALIFRWMRSLSAEQISRRYDEEDSGTTAISVIIVCAAVLSLAAIVAMLATVRQVSGAERVAHTVLAALTLLSSWALVPTVFTAQYAEMFYGGGVRRPPLEFPGTAMPVFWDFAYFSFTIACACQTSDVSTTDTSIRRVVIAQTLVSFLFNAAILGFAINVGAGLLGGSS
ncbi:MAG: DUF1345 domain-containing protein [Gammaproteobacteria bacterium]|nr:DUF1345 domain-containing protein [Gammaproteobacteria bacterium]